MQEIQHEIITFNLVNSCKRKVLLLSPFTDGETGSEKWYHLSEAAQLISSRTEVQMQMCHILRLYCTHPRAKTRPCLSLCVPRSCRKGKWAKGGEGVALDVLSIGLGDAQLPLRAITRREATLGTVRGIPKQGAAGRKGLPGARATWRQESIHRCWEQVWGCTSVHRSWSLHWPWRRTARWPWLRILVPTNGFDPKHVTVPFYVMISSVQWDHSCLLRLDQQRWALAACSNHLGILNKLHLMWWNMYNMKFTILTIFK